MLFANKYIKVLYYLKFHTTSIRLFTRLFSREASERRVSGKLAIIRLSSICHYSSAHIRRYSIAIKSAVTPAIVVTGVVFVKSLLHAHQSNMSGKDKTLYKIIL